MSIKNLKFEAYKPEENKPNELMDYEKFTENLKVLEEELKNVDSLSEEQTENLLLKGKMVIGALFVALGGVLAGLTFNYEILQQNMDSPDKALMTMGVILGGIAAIAGGARLFENAAYDQMETV
jgi:hypothetical protein